MERLILLNSIFSILNFLGIIFVIITFKKQGLIDLNITPDMPWKQKTGFLNKTIPQEVKSIILKRRTQAEAEAEQENKGKPAAAFGQVTPEHYVKQDYNSVINDLNAKR